MFNETLWKTKLHARLHDPAEKALVLLRDPAGHEGGTSRTLHSILFENGIPAQTRRRVKWADWWASAADRPQLPKDAPWARLHWTKDPRLIHPLTGREFDLGTLADTEIADVKSRSLNHFKDLIVRAGGQAVNERDVDWKKTLLAFWRFGPELRSSDADDSGHLGVLWQHLPADTRIPDHSIWDHLDLTSAFAGAFEADQKDQPALFALSIGPVQTFIADARTTSDLWAGSHLLSSLSWEAMRVVCDELGPDAILFPHLRGVPQVDRWLRDQCNLPRKWFEKHDWVQRATDSNPLFLAGLPNRFVAVVPESAIDLIASKIQDQVRDWLDELGGRVVDRLLLESGDRDSSDPRDSAVYAYRQMREQIRGFPEVHWAAVPFSLVHSRDASRQTDIDTSELEEAMAPFLGTDASEQGGFLNSPAWRVLQDEIDWDEETKFYSPKPSVLYPAVYELTERVLAAAKSVRPFEQTKQQGWRCSMTGETEWLTTDPSQLNRSYRSQTDTLWIRVSKRRSALAKAGEHLGALPAIKRMWPTLFAEEVGQSIANGEHVDRFVVSTHCMALAHQINCWLSGDPSVSAELRDAVAEAKATRTALPRGIALRHNKKDAFPTASRIPNLLDRARESDDEAKRRHVEGVLRKSMGLEGQIENYYGLLQMDGDRMGKILSGDCSHAITYEKSFHPRIRKEFEAVVASASKIDEYLKQPRAMSPNRHSAISSALSNFALQVVRRVVEDEFLGRVLYAGGDDVLAMLPAADLLRAMQRLRYAYSGEESLNELNLDWREKIKRGSLYCKNGFAIHNGQLMRLMGGATASCGAVIAHYQTPLNVVLQEVRVAEQRAKNSGRNRFSLTIMKRSGGSLFITHKWDRPDRNSPLELLLRLCRFLSEPAVSRRAAYHILVWLRDLPSTATKEMMSSMIEYQFRRQTSDKNIEKKHNLHGLASDLAQLAIDFDGESGKSIHGTNLAGGRVQQIEALLSVAEFLAREVRSAMFDQ